LKDSSFFDYGRGPLLGETNGTALADILENDESESKRKNV
jgi:hypothetical protein